MNDSEFGSTNESGAEDLMFGGKRIIEIVITHHARTRWNDRVESVRNGSADIAGFLWDRLRAGAVRSYYRHEEDVYLIDEDLVMVAEFTPLKRTEHSVESTYYRMVVVTFLGRMSETMELRDLKSYYSWLRHSRRMTLIKNSRKRR